MLYNDKQVLRIIVIIIEQMVRCRIMSAYVCLLIRRWPSARFSYLIEMSRAMRKCVLCHMRTTKAQISLRIRLCFRCLDSIVSLDSIAEISSLWPASVAAQAGLCLAWSETPEDTFCQILQEISVPNVLNIATTFGHSQI